MSLIVQTKGSFTAAHSPWPQVPGCPCDVGPRQQAWARRWVLLGMGHRGLSTSAVATGALFSGRWLLLGGRETRRASWRRI